MPQRLAPSRGGAVRCGLIVHEHRGTHATHTPAAQELPSGTINGSINVPTPVFKDTDTTKLDDAIHQHIKHAKQVRANYGSCMATSLLSYQALGPDCMGSRTRYANNGRHLQTEELCPCCSSGGHVMYDVPGASECANAIQPCLHWQMHACTSSTPNRLVGISRGNLRELHPFVRGEP